MKYIVARKLNTIGCYAYNVKEKEIQEFLNYLITKTLEKDIEVFTITAPEV